MTPEWHAMLRSGAHRDRLPSQEGGELIAEIVAVVGKQVVGLWGKDLAQLIDVVLQHLLGNLGVPTTQMTGVTELMEQPSQGQMLSEHKSLDQLVVESIAL